MSKSVRRQTEVSSADLVRFLLEATNTEEPPTDANRIAIHLGLSIRRFFHQEYSLDSNIRAFLLPAQKLIGVSRDLSHHRTRFSVLHEVGHYVIPGHIDFVERGGMLLDDDRSLADHSIVTVEMEANRFAADCIFQLERFDREVDHASIDWSTISRFANRFDASMIATARRWVEGSLQACALLVFGPELVANAITLRYLYSITSESFRRRFFNRLAKFTLGEHSETYKAFHETTGSIGLIETISVDFDTHTRDFDLHLFSTRYNVYGLIVE